MDKIKGSHALFRSLKQYDVDTIFGLIGAHTMELFDALYDFQDSIRLITTRDERSAALMADGYGRVSHKPGVCLTSTGPGAANAMSGLGEAYFSFSPVIHVTSTAEENLYGRALGANHETRDQLGMLSSVSRDAFHISTSRDIPSVVRESFYNLAVKRPQPISIEIPVDVQSETVHFENSKATAFDKLELDHSAIELAAKLLLEGRRVGIWAGTGVDRADASQELLHLASLMNVPVFTTPGGKAGFPSDHPLNVGVLGGPGGLTNGPYPLREFVASLDTVLVVGSSLRYTSTVSQKIRLPENLIHIDISPEPMGKNYEPKIRVVGDAKDALQQIILEVDGKNTSLTEAYDKEIKLTKSNVTKYLWAHYPNPMKVMKSIREVVGRSAIFTGDASISATRGANACLEVFEPRTYLPPVWGGLGFAFPASIGAKVAKPDSTVICITGDGGFQFNLQELGTCYQYGISPIVLVFNDNAWGSTRLRQQDNFGGRYIGTGLENPDFVKVAKAFNVNGLSAKSLPELCNALEESMKSTSACVIEISTPKGFDLFN